MRVAVGPVVDEVIVGAIETPAGAFGVALSPLGLGRLTFPAEPLADREAWVRRWLPGARVLQDGRGLAALRDQLSEYLEGRRRHFTVPLDLRGTPFQTRVWRELCAIPYGRTRTYAEVARAIGRPRAVRAVGLANGANPIPILVPCHRVVGTGGGLTGYGGGLAMKRRLLALEGAWPGARLEDIETRPDNPGPLSEEEART